MPYITVFTATYERAHLLPQLYASLRAQTCRDFEWLIIDDGSTDDTRALVAKWMSADNDFPIRYFFKENGGKPRAVNDGVQKADGKFFLIVDSDDELTPDAIEKFCAWCREIEDDERFIGVGAARGTPDGRYLKGVPPRIKAGGYVDATNLERSAYDLDADMCEAYKTDIFRRFPMAQWPNERFAPEQISLNEIALHGYLLRWHAEIVYLCVYRDDGLTKNWRDLVRRNPMGYAMMYNHMLNYPNLDAREKFHAACQHIALSICGRHPTYLWKSCRLRYTLPALPFGLVLAVRRKRQFRRWKK